MVMPIKRDWNQSPNSGPRSISISLGSISAKTEEMSMDASEPMIPAACATTVSYTHLWCRTSLWKMTSSWQSGAAWATPYCYVLRCSKPEVSPNQSFRRTKTEGGFHIGLCTRTQGPVSYTHLDVYKRQALHGQTSRHTGGLQAPLHQCRYGIFQE